MLNKRELTAMRRKLPRGSYQKIAAKTGYTDSMVGKTLRVPKHYNSTIIDTALEVIEEHQKEIAAKKEAVKKIVK